MENKNNSYPEQSPIIIIAALIIIFAGIVFAKAIINPFLIALFISILCAQPISFLQKNKFPKWLTLLIVILSLILFFSGFSFLIGGTLSSFTANVSKYTTALKEISHSFIQYLNEKE